MLDSADVEVSSTEFGDLRAGGRRALRYDYRKDIAVAGFYTNRGIGFTLGGRLHWGEPIDATRFRNNLYGFYTFAGARRRLPATMRNPKRAHRRPARRHRRALRLLQRVLGRGDPTGQRQLRLYVDWYDKNLGSDYGYLDWGYIASATLPLGSPRTVVAADSRQRLQRAVQQPGARTRASTASAANARSAASAPRIELARNIFVLRTELRRELFSDLDSTCSTRSSCAA